jgi:lipopolysaccharide/colanic/teichoic acid biosynthesis glycosyltransferase
MFHRAATGPSAGPERTRSRRRLTRPVEASALFTSDLYPALKRSADVVLALLVAVAAAPLMLAVCALVKLTSRGPVIYTQVRVGRGRRPFAIYKVRTMDHDCERFSGPLWSTENDPRVTPLGRFLRRTHLDEVPQLWNILKGEMSLVGPRPERPEFVRQLERALPRYGERLDVLPGVTGLAQVNLPPDTDHDSVRRKLVYDLAYVENLGPWLDLRILAATGLFLLGVPFAASSRAFGLGLEEPAPDRPRQAQPVELVAQAVPAWNET